MASFMTGARGPSVQLLQLALNRAGAGTLSLDGVFGPSTRAAVTEFQRQRGLEPDGVVGTRTTAALMPYYTGFVTHTVRQGESLYRIAALHGSTLRAVETANPSQDPLNLQPGATVVVPLPFDVVPTNIDYCWQTVAYCVRGISARYPFAASGEFGKSVMGKSLYYITMGSGDRRVLYNAEHHANEWITTPVLLKFAEQLAKAYAFGDEIAGVSARSILSRSTVSLAPAVCPDGMDLVTGELTGGAYYDGAVRIANNFPDIPFPEGWKANIRGVDLNLQYPANWESAREIKFGQGFTQPAPRDYVGVSPLSAPESRAMYDYTVEFDPQAILAYHTQGNVIFWKYLDMEPPGSRELAYLLGDISGYAVEETPYASGFAGYKDWFIQDYDRPGYTIEAGQGVNPLPISDFDGIYSRNVGILVQTAIFET